MPSPSWPAARYKPGVAGQGPISGSLSSVEGRKPVQVRIALSPARPGRNSIARRSMRPRIAASISSVSMSYCLDEPMRICPVRRGCTLQATDSLAPPAALLI